MFIFLFIPFGFSNWIFTVQDNLQREYSQNIWLEACLEAADREGGVGHSVYGICMLINAARAKTISQKICHHFG